MYLLNSQFLMIITVLLDEFSTSRYTTEPYQSVPACREYCSKIAEIQDKSSDR